MKGSEKSCRKGLSPKHLTTLGAKLKITNIDHCLCDQDTIITLDEEGILKFLKQKSQCCGRWDPTADWKEEEEETEKEGRKVRTRKAGRREKYGGVGRKGQLISFPSKRTAEQRQPEISHFGGKWGQGRESGNLVLPTEPVYSFECCLCQFPQLELKLPFQLQGTCDWKDFSFIKEEESGKPNQQPLNLAYLLSVWNGSLPFFLSLWIMILLGNINLPRARLAWKRESNRGSSREDSLNGMQSKEVGRFILDRQAGPPQPQILWDTEQTLLEKEIL